MKVKNFSRVCLIISGFIVLIALVMSIFGAGINLGIDFTGGLNIQYNMNRAFSQDDVADALQAQGISGYTISCSGEGGQTLQIRIPPIGGEEEIKSLQSGLEAALIDKYPEMDKETAAAGSIGPVAGAALVRNAVWIALLAAVIMLMYIAFRFGFNSGAAAGFGLLHDVLIMLSFMVLLRNTIRMNPSFIAVTLIVVGLSFTNTIIIFDRIRENNKKPGSAGMKREVLVNNSVRECLGRTAGSAITTLIIMVALCILGVDSVREFSLPIIIGIVSGIYSANMINGYVWAFLEERRKGRKHAGKKTKKA